MDDFSRNADDDRELLLRYTSGSEAAFTALVERYSGLVYGTAMRCLANPEWAADATQNVFAALAAKASDLMGENIPSVGRGCTALRLSNPSACSAPAAHDAEVRGTADTHTENREPAFAQGGAADARWRTLRRSRPPRRGGIAVFHTASRRTRRADE